MIPQVDHFLGRKFVGVKEAPDDTVQWAVELDGNVLIRNYDEDIPAPTGDPTGLALMQVVNTTTNTELKFGNLNPDGTPNFGPSITFSLDYTISAPGLDEIKPRPAASHFTPAPSDPSPDRVVLGPT